MKLYFYILFILSVFHVSAQTITDSLKDELSKIHNDTIYVNTLNKLSEQYRYKDADLALDYALKAEKTAQNCNYHFGTAMSYKLIGDLYLDKQKYRLSENNYKKSIETFEENNDKEMLSDIYNNMGLLYCKLQKNDNALKFFQKSLTLQQKIQDSTTIATLYENIGYVYYCKKQYNKALINLYNSLRLKESLNMKSGIADSYKRIGKIYYELESLDQARVNLERSINYYKTVKDTSQIAEVLYYLGNVYKKQERYADAIETFTECIEINKKIDNLKRVADSYLNTGKIYTETKNINGAYTCYINSLSFYYKIRDIEGIVDSKYALALYFYNSDKFDNAKTHLLEAEKYFNEYKSFKKEYEVNYLLSQIYFSQEDYYNAAITLKKAVIYIDSLHNEELENKISQLSNKYNFDKKVLQDNLQSVKNSSKNLLLRQKYLLLLIILCLIVLSITLIVFIIYRKNKQIKTLKNFISEKESEISVYFQNLSKANEDLKHKSSINEKALSVIETNMRIPFNAINSFISIVAEQSKNINDEKTIKYLQLIKDSGTNAMNLLENLIEWIKLQNNEITPQNEDVFLNYIIRGNILLIKERAKQKNIEIIEELSDNPIISIDKNIINTIIRNLLSNAIKFTGLGGRITIKTIQKDSEIKIVIQDTGIGMTDEQMSKIFETQTIKLDGEIKQSGLGIIICKEFLQLYRQELRVDSKVNFGTTFWFYLDVKETP